VGFEFDRPQLLEGFGEDVFDNPKIAAGDGILNPQERPLAACRGMSQNRQMSDISATVVRWVLMKCELASNCAPAMLPRALNTESMCMLELTDSDTSMALDTFLRAGAVCAMGTFICVNLILSNSS
jgi:hypothetical protein